jgi:hypothetical protein
MKRLVLLGALAPALAACATPAPQASPATVITYTCATTDGLKTFDVVYQDNTATVTIYNAPQKPWVRTGNSGGYETFADTGGEGFTLQRTAVSATIRKGGHTSFDNCQAGPARPVTAAVPVS